MLETRGLEDMKALFEKDPDEYKVAIVFLDAYEKKFPSASDMWEHALDSLQTLPRQGAHVEDRTLHDFSSPLQKFFAFGAVSGGMLSERDVALALVRYQLIPSGLVRTKYNALYRALKQHLRTFFRQTYNMYQKLLWKNTGGLLKAVFTGKVPQLMQELADVLRLNATQGFEDITDSLLGVFRVYVSRNLPGGENGFAGYSQFVVMASALVACISMYAEGKHLIANDKIKGQTFLAYLVEQLNSVVIGSTFRYKTVLRLFARILRILGPSYSGGVVRALMSMQNPKETAASLTGLPTLRDVDAVPPPSASTQQHI
eukprot:1524997-Rhodomonas_salina.2